MVKKPFSILLLFLFVIFAVWMGLTAHQPVDQSINQSKEIQKVYNLSWGEVVLETFEEHTSVPSIILNISSSGKGHFMVENKTEKLRVTRFAAYSHSGEFLWEHYAMSPYLWKIYWSSTLKSQGISEPLILVSHTSDYLFIVELYSGPKEMPDVRAKLGMDWLYIFGKEGIIKKMNLGKGYWPKRNAFLVSNGTYTLFGFEQPEGDGSPAYGRVIIFNNTEVIFDKTFEYDPDCLCNVIPGWGEISEDGHAIFGLYNGIGIFNGTFEYKG